MKFLSLKKLTLKVPTAYSNLLVYSFFLYPVFTYFLSNFIPSIILVITVNLIILLLFFLLVKDCGIKKDIIYVYLITIALFFIYSLQGSLYQSLYLDPQWGLVAIYGVHTGIFGYALIRSIINLSDFEKQMKKISIILIIFYSIQCLQPLLHTYWIIDGKQMVYNMTFGYSIQFPIIFLIYFYLKEKNIIFLIFGFLGIIEIILFGSRGPLIGIFIYSIMQFIKYKKKNKNLRIILSLILIIIIFLILSNNLLIQNTLQFLSEHGITSRTLSKLANDVVTDDTGRSIVRQGILELLNKFNICFGYGPLGDHVLTGHYSHNILLEVIITFGIVVGPILIVAFIFSFLYSYIKSKNTLINNYILIFACLSLPKLFVSSSFWRESNFWILLGLIVTVIRDKKNLQKL